MKRREEGERKKLTGELQWMFEMKNIKGVVSAEPATPLTALEKNITATNTQPAAKEPGTYTEHNENVDTIYRPKAGPRNAQ